MMVFFDLPVVEKQERKDATAFRNFLLDNGFQMIQYSIYVRIFSSSEACEKYYNLIEHNIPERGRVDVLTITDRQYSNIKSFECAKSVKKTQDYQQLLMF